MRPPHSYPQSPSIATILLVDDEAGVLSALRRALSRHGHQVLLTSTAEEALQLLAGRGEGELPQVVLADYRLPCMDGVTLLGIVRARWPDLQRILLTGYADLSAMERAVNEAGIYRFLHKPWDDVSLQGTLRAALEHWQASMENRRLLRALEEHNRSLEEAVAMRTRELSAAQELWERTFNAISDPLLVLDEDFRVLRANQALRRHLGLAGPPEGCRCHELRAASRFALPRTTEGPCVGCPVPLSRAGEAAAELTGEAGTLAVRAYPLQEGLSVCVYRDVTREREALRHLTLTDRMAAIGQLAGGVAHELNNPLGGILGAAQLLLRDLQRGNPQSTDELKEFLGEIEGAAQRCKRIVENLLRFSRQAQQDQVGAVDLNQLAEQTAHLVERPYRLRGVELTLCLAPALPLVLGSAAQLQQVLMNLLSNALDATLQLRGGRPGPPGLVEVRTAAVEEEVRLWVCDQGAGIEEEHRVRLFDPFFSTKPEGRGKGLGLAVAYGIVSDHGGRIDVRNRSEGGAEFLLRLPVLP